MSLLAVCVVAAAVVIVASVSREVAALAAVRADVAALVAAAASDVARARVRRVVEVRGSSDPPIGAFRLTRALHHRQFRNPTEQGILNIDCFHYSFFSYYLFTGCFLRNFFNQKARLSTAIFF